MRLCEYPNCHKQHIAKGYCWGHYQQLRRGKRLMPLRDRSVQNKDCTCEVEGCHSSVLAKGLCSRHYSALRYHGTPTPAPRPRKREPCALCGQPPAVKRNMCHRCYQREYRRGTFRDLVQTA